MAKNQAKAKPHSQAKLLLFQNYSLFSFTLSPKNTRRYSKKLCRKQVCLFKWGNMINDNENEAENESRSHRYDINRPRPKHVQYKINI